MATYYARKSGNINAADVWATTPTGTASNLFPTFTNADVLMSNSFLVTVNVNTTVNTCRGDTFGGASTGGQFALNNGITLNSNVTSGGSFHCVGANSGSSTIVGSVSNFGVDVNGTGTISIIGNVSGTSTNGARINSPTATINITGNVTGGAQIGVNVASGTLNITNGTITGGTTTSIYGVHNVTNGTVNVTNGIVTGGNASSAFGIRNESNGIVNINGIATGGNGLSATSGVSNASTGNVFLKRAVGNGFGPGSTGVAGAVGLTNSGTGFVSVEEIEFGTLGMSPVSGGGIRLKKLGTNVAVFNYCDTAGAKTLVDATQGQMPAAADVRSGVSYASGALTGSAFIPSPSSVASGVPVDATTGTAVLTGAAVATSVWGAVARTITGGTITGAADITAIKAKTDLLNTDRLGQVATTSIVGNLIAQSNS